MMNRDVLIKLVEAGIEASSPDNSQPWKFKFLDDGIELYLDKRYLGMFFDANRYGSLLGCGGVIENIRLMAEKYGFETTICRHSITDQTLKVATLSFVESHHSEYDPLTEAIDERCTYRGLFRHDSLDLQIKKNIEKSLIDIEGGYIHWFSTPQQKQSIIRIVTHTDRLRYTHKRLHDDFYSKLRFGKNINRTRDGLAANTLGIERIFTLVLPLFKSWALTRILNFFGMHYFMAWRGATVPLKNAADIGALVMSRTCGPAEQGKVLQRMWLTINGQPGLHCQMFGALPLFIYRMKEYGGRGFTSAQQHFLNQNIKELDDLVELNSDEQSVIMLFRLGYPRQKVIHSLRRPVNSFIIG